MAEHRSTLQTYGIVFAALIVLTAITLLLGGVDLGAWHAIVGLAIATTKATLGTYWAVKSITPTFTGTF